MGSFRPPTSAHRDGAEDGEAHSQGDAGSDGDREVAVHPHHGNEYCDSHAESKQRCQYVSLQCVHLSSLVLACDGLCKPPAVAHRTQALARYISPFRGPDDFNADSSASRNASTDRTASS